MLVVGKIKKNMFSCPNCKKKLPFKKTLNVVPNVSFRCPNCNVFIIPTNAISFAWGASIGFCFTVIPAKLYLSYFDDIIGALLVGLTIGSLSFGGVCFYIYYKTLFKIE